MSKKKKVLAIMLALAVTSDITAVKADRGQLDYACKYWTPHRCDTGLVCNADFYCKRESDVGAHGQLCVYKGTFDHEDTQECSDDRMQCINKKCEKEPLYHMYEACIFGGMRTDCGDDLQCAERTKTCLKGKGSTCSGVNNHNSDECASGVCERGQCTAP